MDEGKDIGECSRENGSGRAAAGQGRQHSQNPKRSITAASVA
jgi:hypothetical protein